MIKRMGWLAVGMYMSGSAAWAGFSESPTPERQIKKQQEPASIQLAGFKLENKEVETAALTTPKKQPRVVAYCVMPGSTERFVITSDAQLVQITKAGVATVIGVVIAPTSSEFLCMIKTENTLIGINGSGHLVNTENGNVVGAVVPIESKEDEPAKETAPDTKFP